ncbi:MAG: hypothetical protein ABSF83_03285 [Nitrososphaerales archaeon]|jgi:hypothetical protein
MSTARSIAAVTLGALGAASILGYAVLPACAVPLHVAWQEVCIMTSSSQYGSSFMILPKVLLLGAGSVLVALGLLVWAIGARLRPFL